MAKSSRFFCFVERVKWILITLSPQMQSNPSDRTIICCCFRLMFCFLCGMTTTKRSKQPQIGCCLTYPRGISNRRFSYFICLLTSSSSRGLRFFFLSCRHFCTHVQRLSSGKQDHKSQAGSEIEKESPQRMLSWNSQPSWCRRERKLHPGKSLSDLH